MALADMLFEIQGSAPGIDAAIARTLVNESWLQIRNLSGWSFQLGSGGFSTVTEITGGTVTLQFGSPTVTPDANALALWTAGSEFGSLITQRQFRQLGGTIYNILSFNGTVITLDRPFTDNLPTNTAPVAGLSYMLYQPYIATPVKDFIRWLAILDVTNVAFLKLNYERKKIDLEDPQRQIFSNPLCIIPYEVDQRSMSSTLGWMLYEMYPQPVQAYSYQTWWQRLGADLVNLSDTLPFPITEQLVKSGARKRAYELAEANKDPQNPRGAGADFRFLIGKAEADYQKELKKLRLLDRNRVDMFNTTMTRFGIPAPLPFYNMSTGTLSVSNLA